MTLKSQIYPGSIGFFLIWLQNLEMCSTMNKVGLKEIDYLASNLTPGECFQLYNLLDRRHVNRVETLKYINKRNQVFPCINLLSTWSTDPDESNNKAFDRVALKLEKIGRKDLARWIDRGSIRQKDEINLNHITGAKELDDEKTILKTRLDDEKQRSTYQTSGKMRIFWKAFFVSLIILILLLICACCYRYIYAKLRCICSRSKFDKYGDNKMEDEYYLCTDQYKTSSFQNCCTNKKSSNFGKTISNMKNYFENRKEKRQEKFRCQEFQKLKIKLQKMYFDQQKEVRVNRQEEKILNSLTEEERDELGEIIREMKFYLDSDEETERLLLSKKRQGTFIINIKNFHQQKNIYSPESNQDIEVIKKWELRNTLSSSLSEKTSKNYESKTNETSETTRSNREKKNLKDQNKNRRKSSRHYFENNSDYTSKKEYSISKVYESNEKIKLESEKINSIHLNWENNQKCSLESENSNFSTSEETDLSTFRSENPLETLKNQLQIVEEKKVIQNIKENDEKKLNNIIKSGSMIEIGSRKSKFHFQNEESNNEKNRGDYLEYKKNKKSHNNKKKNYLNSSITSIDSNYGKKNSIKTDEYYLPLKNLENGDIESQSDLCDTYDELGLLFSQHMKQQSRPCYRKYCLLRRHLKQRIHDSKQCCLKKNYFQYYPNDQAPSCSSGNICKDTYDEFNLMLATPQDRKKIRQKVYERRKKFLDQPCVSPGR